MSAAMDAEMRALRAVSLRAGAARGMLSAEEFQAFRALPAEDLAAADALLQQAKRDELGVAPTTTSPLDPWLLKCESPAEARMLGALADVGKFAVVDGSLRLTSLDGSPCTCEPQLIAGRRRIDFAVFGTGVSIAVEVDGYSYHYATPELAEATLDRNRELLGVGWRTCAFTARQVDVDAIGCAREVLSLVRWVP